VGIDVHKAFCLAATLVPGPETPVEWRETNEAWGPLPPLSRLAMEAFFIVIAIEHPFVVIFATRPEDPDRDYFSLALGMSSVLKGGTQAFAGYEAVLGLEDITNQVMTAGLRLEL